MEIVFRADGSLLFVNINEPINQGSNNVNFVHCAVEGLTPGEDFTVKANFRLPTGQVAQVIGETPDVFSVDGTEYSGYKVPLGSYITAYAGYLVMNLLALRLDNTALATYQVRLNVNKTHVEGSTTITTSELNNLVASLSQYQLKFNLSNCRCYPSIEAARLEQDKLAEGQVILTYLGEAITPYKKSGGILVPLELEATPYSAGSGITIANHEISVDGTIARVSQIPTRTSQLNNDSGFITASYHDATKQDVLTAGANITIVDGVISATDTTYQNLPAVDGGTSESLVTTGNKWTWNHKQDALTAGSNITIVENVISAINTTYTSKAEASGGTAVSLCTTGEKYNWNHKSSVSAATTGTSSTEAKYLTIDGTEYKLSGGTEVVWRTF